MHKDRYPALFGCRVVQSVLAVECVPAVAADYRQIVLVNEGNQSSREGNGHGAHGSCLPKEAPLPSGSGASREDSDGTTTETRRSADATGRETEPAANGGWGNMAQA